MTIKGTAVKPLLINITLLSCLSACTHISTPYSTPSTQTSQPPNLAGSITLPVFQAWHENQPAYYISTDTSDPEMAKKMNINYVPRLADAIPDYPKPPTQKTALERVYGFPNGEQAFAVFPSVPQPVGPNSNNPHYSPLWLLYQVRWINPEKRTELRSETAILDAEAQELVTVDRTRAVINCPVVTLPSPK